MKALAQLEARAVRHHQIEQDRPRFVFQSESQRLYRIARVDRLVSIRQSHLDHPAQGIIVVNDQNLLHCFLLSNEVSFLSAAPKRLPLGPHYHQEPAESGGPTVRE